MLAFVVSALLSLSAPAPQDVIDGRSSKNESYERHLEAVTLAISQVDDGDNLAISALRNALSDLSEVRRQLAHDRAGQRLRLGGRLTLVRALLAKGSRTEAQQLLDEALRTWREQPIRAEEYGPRVADFHAQRRRDLTEGSHGTLEIVCERPCRVYINEVEGGQVYNAIAVGPYRLRIEDVNHHEHASYQVKIEIQSHPVTTTIRYPAQRTLHLPSRIISNSPAVGPAATFGGVQDPDTVFKNARRISPQWLEVAGLVVGCGSSAVGLLLLGMNDRCYGGGTATGPKACPRVYQTVNGGIIALSAGLSSIVIFTFLLALNNRDNRIKFKRVSLHGNAVRF